MLLVVILTLAAGTYVLRLAGVLLRDRLDLPAWSAWLLPLMATTLLTALAVTTALTEDGRLAGLARPAGVLVGVVLAWRRAPFLVVVLAAAGTTALLRLAGID